MQKHAREIIVKRLAAARKNHGIEKDVALNDAQIAYVVGVICRWIEREIS